MPRRRADPDAAAANVVRLTLNETKPGLDAHSERTRRYDKAYDIWRSPDKPGERQQRNMPGWMPLLKVKYAMHTVDQAMVNTSGGIPHARCTPRTQASVMKAKAMEHLLAYYTDLAHLAEHAPLIDQQAMVYAVSPAKTRWLYKEADRTMLVPAVDPQTGEILWQPGTQRIVECDRPDMQPWDVYDIWWEPTAKDPDSAAYIVLRCWPSKQDLMAGAYNEDTGVGQYRNLDLLFAAGPGDQRPQTAQNKLLDSSAQPYKDRFEVWEVWRDDRLTVIGNRQIMLYDGPKPYWMPGKPVTISHSRPDFFKIEGISETELMDHLQQTLQTEDNLRLENFRFTVQRGATVRETVPNMADLVMQPHFLWKVTDHDDVKFVDQPPLPPEAYQEHETLLGLMQLVTGINPYVTGAGGQSGTDQNTATGVSLLSTAAGRMLQYKRDLIARHTWQRMFEQWGHLTKQFLRTEVELNVTDRDEASGEPIGWVRYGPADVFGDYDVRIEATEESLNKQQRRADAIALLNALAPFAQMGLIDPKPLLRQVAEAFGFARPDDLLAPPSQQQMAAPGNPPAQAPTPFMLGGQIAPQPQLSVMAGNAR